MIIVPETRRTVSTSEKHNRKMRPVEKKKKGRQVLRGCQIYRAVVETSGSAEYDVIVYPVDI